MDQQRSTSATQHVVGRGAQIEPPNRFEAVHLEADWEQLEHDELAATDERRIPTQFFADATRSLITQNDSPDIPFRYSINPYRGCEHGCAYCYARPGHEMLGLNAGLDFETKVFYKPDAAKLLRAELCKAIVARGSDRDVGCDRLLSAGRAAAADYARLHRGDDRSAASVWHH